MAIEREHWDLYQQVGLYLTPEDSMMTEYEESGIIIYVSFADDMIYLSPGENTHAFPVKIRGDEFVLLWWMYRLSDRKCRFQDYLAEYLIPLYRQYFNRKKNQ